MERTSPESEKEERLEKWIQRYSARILRMNFLFLCDHALAEDAMQDTFFKAWKAMDKRKNADERSEQAWLFQIAINTCRDYKRGAYFRHMDLKNAMEDLPPQMLAMEERDKSLFLDILRMPDPCKRVLILYYYENLTLTEVGQILGLSPSAVHKRLRKAEDMLRQEIKEADQE